MMLTTLGGLVSGLFAVAVLQPPAPGTVDPKPVVREVLLAPPKPAFLGDIETSAGAFHRPTVRKLADAFDRIGYNLDHILAQRGSVPRLFPASLPSDMGQIREVKLRKALFLMTVLPHVLRVNEEILANRKRLWRLRNDLKVGRKLSAVDQLWLAIQAQRYHTKADDIDTLLNRMDVVPPSLALAQAAIESGWGTSRFAREGNALFGQWTWSDDGVVPLDRDAGKTHRIRAFKTIEGSVRGYMRNLNTHRAYRQFRAVRAELRREGAPLDGMRLVGTLSRYSERGEAYVDSLRTVIANNDLRRLDDVRLEGISAPQPTA